MPRWLSLPNLLSLLRLPMALLIVALLSMHAAFAAMLVFWMAVASDVLDGRIARARGQSSNMGGLLDHGSDALLVAMLLAFWSWRGEVPLCLPILVPLAFLQYVFDSRALAGQPLRGSRIGRWNGIAYFVLAGIPTVRDGLQLTWPPAPLVHGIGWLLILTTLVSMCERALLFLRAQRTARAPPPAAQPNDRSSDRASDPARDPLSK